MKKLTLITFVFSICYMHLSAVETNRYFVSLDEQYRNVTPQDGKTNECLPAEQFPEGNWGIATNGIHVSLRFDKSSYTNGEPIVATILVRNVSESTVDYVSIYSWENDGPVRFFVTSQDDRNLDSTIHNISATSSNIPVGSQRKFVERFDKDYHLTNGVYFVRAYVMPPGRRAYIESAKVPIKITSSP